MSRLRHIEELAVDAEFYAWCLSPEGRKYWEDYGNKTRGMNLWQYCMHIDIINNIIEYKDGKE